MKLRRIAFLLAAAVVVAIAFVGLQRYTAYGVSMFGGGGYWVRKAVATQDVGEAKMHLRRVVNATQYGVNTAENGVSALPDRDDRRRMWSYLIELAPNDNWRAIYSARLAREESP